MVDGSLGEARKVAHQFAFPDFETAEILQCGGCDQLWLRCYLEDSWVSRSGRWWRVPVDTPSLDNPKVTIESAEWCIAGGEYHRPSDKDGSRLYLADGTERVTSGFIVRAPIKVY